ncbi:MAG: proliferating cell nuclear antigen (pcna) [Thermoplasmata archaeon HGW-Thermoplasmata-1]|nr:MAG: proliferating cell nuclear antigen (pcna) [Thermoplasmata archaeon HGW-Thermoplasmata-1]
MFKAKIKADILKTVIDTTSILVDEAKFHITPEGISLKAVDPAHVAMVDLSLGSKAFEEYKAEDLELGIDLGKLDQIMKLASAGDVISLDYKEDAHRLVVKVANIVRKMSLVDTAGMPDAKVPNLNLPAEVVVKSSEISQGVLASKAISDHVALTADTDGFELSAEGDTDSVNLKLPKDLLVSLKSSERVKSLFSLDYFANMIKAAKSSDAILLKLGNDYPVMMEFDIADGNGHVVYLLAPRIESD